MLILSLKKRSKSQKETNTIQTLSPLFFSPLLLCDSLSVEASSTEEIQIFQEKEIILKLHLQEGNKERNHLFDKLKNYEQKMKELEGVVQQFESSKKTTTKKDDIDLFFLCSFENVVEKIKDLNRGLLLLLGGISPD
jgi:hypothetical protein